MVLLRLRRSDLCRLASSRQQSHRGQQRAGMRGQSPGKPRATASGVQVAEKTSRLAAERQRQMELDANMEAERLKALVAQEVRRPV